MRTINTKKCTGFTMIELLVVIAIIAILAAIALPQYMAQQQRIAYADVVNSVQTMKKAVHACLLSRKDANRCSTQQGNRDAAVTAAVISVTGYPKIPDNAQWIPVTGSKNVSLVAAMNHGFKNTIFVEARSKGAAGNDIKYTLRGTLNASGTNVKWVTDKTHSTCLNLGLCK